MTCSRCVLSSVMAGEGSAVWLRVWMGVVASNDMASSKLRFGIDEVGL